MGDECTLSMKVRAQALTPFPQTGETEMIKNTMAYIVNIDGLPGASNLHNKDFMFNPEISAVADVAHYEAHAYFTAMKRLIRHLNLGDLFDGTPYRVRIELLVKLIGSDTDAIPLMAHEWDNEI